MNRTLGLRLSFAGLVVAGLIAVPIAAAANPNFSITSTSGLGLGVGSGVAATARLNHLGQVGDSEINRRLATLRADASFLAGLPAGLADVAALGGLVSADTGSLGALKTKLAAETDAKTAAADVKSIVFDYRVYALLEPQIHVVLAADRVERSSGVLNALAVKLAAKAAGKTLSTQAQASLADIKTQAAAALSGAQGVAAAVLALTPGANGGNYPNPDVGTLKAEATALGAARQSIQKGLQDARRVAADLQ